MQHHCVVCGTQFPVGFHPTCNTCDGLVDIEYPLNEVELVNSTNPYVRFAGLLPVERLHDRLPSAGYTPLVHAMHLGRELAMPSLYLKDETILPTKTTKDRMAAISLAYLHERGVRAFCASSTGNSGTSFAHAIKAHPEMHAFLFTAEKFVPRVHHTGNAQVTHFGMRDATFVEASTYASHYARAYGLASESGFFNAGRREGLKLAFLEACEQAPQPIHWYVQAVSSAMGVYGAYKGARELLGLNRLQQIPRMLCVQQESCAPMVRAFSEKSETIRPEHLVHKPMGIAEAILRGDPTRAYPYVRRVVMESKGDFIAVSEEEIRLARKRVEEYEGISPCFSASAAVAGVIKMAEQDKLSRKDVIVINLTGGDRTESQEPVKVEWIEKGPDGWNAPPPPAFVSDSHAVELP